MAEHMLALLGAGAMGSAVLEAVPPKMPPNMSMGEPPSSRRTEKPTVEIYWSTARVQRYQPHKALGSRTSRTKLTISIQCRR